MKFFLKIITETFFKFFINILNKVNIGRYFLDVINNNIIRRKKKVFYKDLNLTFYVPNRLSYYRADTFSTKEPETLSWIDSFDVKSTFWDIGANIGVYSCYAAKKKIAVFMLLNLRYLILNGLEGTYTSTILLIILLLFLYL